MTVRQWRSLQRRRQNRNVAPSAGARTSDSIVERIAHVPPETVKINLHIATMGLQMMGLRDALLLANQLSAPAHVMLREEFRRPLDDARFNKGTKEYLMLRDGPFQPEPFGPRSKRGRGLE